MLRRTTNAAFGAGQYVFPGGQVDDVDAADEIAPDLRRSRRRDRVGAARHRPRRSRVLVAAVRECFEEAGVLLARADGGGGRAATLRQRRTVTRCTTARCHWSSCVDRDDLVLDLSTTHLRRSLDHAARRAAALRHPLLRQPRRRRRRSRCTTTGRRRQPVGATGRRAADAGRRRVADDPADGGEPAVPGRRTPTADDAMPAAPRSGIPPCTLPKLRRRRTTVGSSAIAMPGDADYDATPILSRSPSCRASDRPDADAQAVASRSAKAALTVSSRRAEQPGHVDGIGIGAAARSRSTIRSAIARNASAAAPSSGERHRLARHRCRRRPLPRAAPGRAAAHRSSSASAWPAARTEQCVRLAVVAGERAHVLDHADDRQEAALGHVGGPLGDLLRGDRRRGDDDHRRARQQCGRGPSARRRCRAACRSAGSRARPSATSARNCSTALVSIRPRHISAVDSSTRKPVDTTLSSPSPTARSLGMIFGLSEPSTVRPPSGR